MSQIFKRIFFVTFALMVGILCSTILLSLKLGTTLERGNVIIPSMVEVLYLVLFAVCCASHVGQRIGLRKTLLSLGAIAMVAFTTEYVGVTTGKIFGYYVYSDRLQPQILGIPIAIALGWFGISCVGVESFSYFLRRIPRKVGYVIVSAMGGLLAVSWDLVGDPVNVAAENWEWLTEGWYFGIPLQNFLGWWILGFITCLILIYLTFDEESLKSDAHPHYYVALVYAVLILQEIVRAIMYGIPSLGIFVVVAFIPYVMLKALS